MCVSFPSLPPLSVFLKRVSVSLSISSSLSHVPLLLLLICGSICLYQSLCFVRISVCIFIYQSIYLAIYVLSNSLFSTLSTAYPALYPPVYLSVQLSIYPSVIFLSIYLSLPLIISQSRYDGLQGQSRLYTGITDT